MNMSAVDFTLIQNALTGYNGDIDSLFTVETWKILLKNVIRETQEANKYEDDECLTKLAEETIEQITESSYSQKVSQILAKSCLEDNRNGNEFLKLCEEYKSRKTNNQLAEVIDEVFDMEIEEDENDSEEIVTSRLSVQNSHALPPSNQIDLAEPIDQRLPFMYRPRRGLPNFNLINALERPNIRDQYEENSHIIPTHPIFQLSLKMNEDERLSSDEDLESSPPHKKRRTEDEWNPLQTQNSFCPQSIMKPIEGGDSPFLGLGPFPSSLERFNRLNRHTRKNLDDDKNMEKINPSEEQMLKNFPTTEKEISKDYPHPPSSPPLNLAMFDTMREAMSQAEKKVVSAFGQTITKQNLSAYDEGEWFEDVNIDIYLEMIKDRNNQENCPYPNVYIFNSYFFKLLQKSYSLVKDTTGKDNIFDYPLIIIPIHAASHWSLVVVDFRKKSINCYDSMGFVNAKNLRKIHTYIYREFRRQQKNNPGSIRKDLFENPDSHTLKPFYAGWTTSNSRGKTVPLQKNGTDCGVFCLQYAEYLSRDCDFDFVQIHMPYFRKRIFFETITKTLLIS